MYRVAGMRIYSIHDGHAIAIRNYRGGGKRTSGRTTNLMIDFAGVVNLRKN